MEKNYEFEQVVNGIRFRWNKCDHCGDIPSYRNIWDQVERIEKEYGAACAVCGEKQKVTETLLYHHKQDGLDRWGGHVTLVEEFIHGRIEIENVVFHKNCLKAALPYSSFGDNPCVQCRQPIKGPSTYHHPRAGGGPYCVKCCEENENITLT